MGFTFGDNWLRFSSALDEEGVREAEASLERLIGIDMLRGRSFVDVGAGSGLFSIAAVRAGAHPVVALDRDGQCLEAIRRNASRFLRPDQKPTLQVRIADILRPETLGDSVFDVVYAWGSLHHTGAMWPAIGNAARLCRAGGHFVIAIYNRTPSSPIWLRIKRLYHAVPEPVELVMAAVLTGVVSGGRLLKRKHPFRSYRGMSVWHDAVDWLGGLPYEYATPGEVTAHLDELGFTPVRENLTHKIGCNEFTFLRR